MSERLLDDVVTSALTAIRARQSSKHKAVSWFRIRPSGPADLSIAEIADITGFPQSEVRLLDAEYLREVAEMGQLLRDFIDRADRVLAFRRLLESFDDDLEIHEATNDELLMNVTLCQVLLFLSHRGAPLLDADTRADLLREAQRLLDANESGLEFDLASLLRLRANLGFALELATPRPLPALGDDL